MNTDNAQQVIKNIVDRFQSGDIAPLVDIATLHLTNPRNSPMAKWSWLNQVIAYAATQSTDCRAYGQWKFVGRQVRKGEHATYILAPITIKDETDPDRLKVVGFRSLPVFADYQTDGEPLPEPEDLTPTTPPPLAQVAEAWNIPLAYVPGNTNWLGQYDIHRKTITLATHAEQVFFHELAHAAHNRIAPLKGGQQPEQETIAEFTACVLMHMCGLTDTTGNTWQYIQHYNPENPIKAITAALDTIEQVIQLILSTSGRAGEDPAGHAATIPQEMETICH